MFLYKLYLFFILIDKIVVLWIEIHIIAYAGSIEIGCAGWNRTTAPPRREFWAYETQEVYQRPSSALLNVK